MGNAPVIASSSPRPHRFGALGHRNFRLYFGGHLVSLIGWAMHSVAQPWLVLLLTDSAWYVGVVAMLGTLPILVFSLYGGVVADRFPKRRVLLVTQLAAMVIAVSLAVVVFSGRVTLGHVMVAATCLGVMAAFDIPGRQAFLVDLVGKPDLMSAIALNSAAFNSSRIVGPAVAGVLIGAFGVGICFLLNGFSYLALLAALLLMRFSADVGAGRAPTTRSPVTDGLRYVGSDRRMRTLMLMIASASVFGFPYHILMPVVARETLGLGSREFGWMVSATAFGALVAALGLATVARHLPKGRLVAWAAPLFGLLVATLGIAPGFGIVLGVLALTGFAQVVHTATTNTLLQSMADDQFRGRVMSVYTVAFLGLMPFGALLAGAVAERFGAGTWLVASGLTCSALMAAALRSAPEVARS